jgi:hypothetical protein
MERKYTEDQLNGKRFWALTCLGFSHIKGRVHHMNWKCDCGNTITYYGGAVVNGAKKSCGCGSYPRKNKSHFWKGCGELSGTLWYRIQKSALKRQIDFVISIDEAWELFEKQNRKCALTQIPLTFQKSTVEFDGTASLDRIDSTKGYVAGNVQWVHKEVNLMKNQLTQERFVELCQKVAESQVKTPGNPEFL